MLALHFRGITVGYNSAFLHFMFSA